MLFGEASGQSRVCRLTSPRSPAFHRVGHPPSIRELGRQHAAVVAPPQSVRYTIEKRTIKGDSTATSVVGAVNVTTLQPSSFRSNVPTWRISLDHDFAHNILGYLSWNRGFKSGGYNAQAPTQPAYAPEYLDAYEGGFKSTLFGNRLRLNAAAFLYEYRDIQVNALVGSLGIIYNGARAKIYGLDMDVDLALSDRLSLTGGVVALHDRFTNFPDGVSTLSLGNGLVKLVPASATGNRLPFAPDISASVYSILNSSNSFQFVSYLPPRTFGVTLGAKF